MDATSRLNIQGIPNSVGLYDARGSKRNVTLRSGSDIQSG